mmetsp:Transcript_18715/g.28473  ORF Transcript_18715/g.28473 Transcript_18715/m.28473 type:complete len:98 (+) Transcript_18715:234-527(+)
MRKDRTFLITMLAPDVMRCSFLAPLLPSLPSSAFGSSISSSTSNNFTFQRASSSSAIASFIIGGAQLCSTRFYESLIQSIVVLLMFSLENQCGEESH